MSGFRKAKTEQAVLKMGLYGLAGSGKTFTSLLLAEGLARLANKRVAVIDTEHGADFYCQDVAERKAHPSAFDFDAVYTRSVTEALEAVRSLKPAEHGVLVIDSISHIWEAALNAYAGKLTKVGTIPFHAWGKIKKPYKELVQHCMNAPMHLIICGRQGNVWQEDEDTEEMKITGTKMRAEGETPYEPHLLIHMEAVRNQKTGVATITAFAEKDRTGVLAGQVIEWPCFDNIVKPLLPLLGVKQAEMPSEEDTGRKDAETLTEQEKARITESGRLLGNFTARFALAVTKDDLAAISKEITPEVKKHMTSGDVADLRERYLEAEHRIK
jgi:hypothetical protein